MAKFKIALIKVAFGNYIGLERGLDILEMEHSSRTSNELLL